MFHTEIDGRPLFLGISALGYEGLEKEAVYRLGRDPAKWEQEIISYLHEQHPYLGDYKIRIHINRTDKESGTAVGQIILDEKLAIPIIVDDFKLAPLDLFYYEEKLRPLTKPSLLAALQQTGIGKPVRPGMGETSDVSLYNVTRPPFSGKYSYASGLNFTLDQYEQMLNELGPEGLEYALGKNIGFAKVAAAFATGAVQEMPKVASVQKTFKTELIEFDAFEPITGPGVYEVVAGGLEKVAGVVFDQVFDLRGNVLDGYKIFCSPEGKIALAEDMGGKPVSEPSDDNFSDDPREAGLGFFWMVKEGKAFATVPMKILYTGTDEEQRPYIKVASLSPDGGVYNVFTSPEYDLIGISGDKVFLGKDWTWKKCGETIKVAGAVKANQTMWPEGAAEMRFRDHRYTLHGIELDELSKEGESQLAFFEKVKPYFGQDPAIRLMAEAEERGSAFFRAEPAEVYMNWDWEKLGAIDKVGGGPSPINLIREAAFVHPVKDVLFFKLAAEVTEDQSEKTIDSMLALNFLTDENMHKFVEHVDELEDSLGVLSKLLLASRLGLKVEEAPIRTSLFSLDEVVRQLQQLRNVIYGAKK